MPTTDIHQDAAALRHALQDLARQLSHQAPTRLTPNQATVLDWLDDHGPATPGEIAAAEHLHPQSLTRILNDLDQRGWLLRTRANRDRRQALLSITDAGRTSLIAHHAGQDASLAAALAQLSPLEYAHVSATIRLLRELTTMTSTTHLPHTSDIRSHMSKDDLMTTTNPAWIDHAIFWHIYPLGMLGADMTGQDHTPTHRLADLVGWLDYAITLGVNGLLLGPIFESRTHGYDTVDYFQIDRRLGTDDDLRRLIDEAHKRGIRVVLDGVFNHVSQDFWAFRQARDQGPDSPEATMFHLRWDGDQMHHASWEGHDQLVQLNHDDPAVVDHVFQAMSHWLAAGIDGWRLDAAYSTNPAFWAAVLPRVRRAWPDAWIMGEIIHGDYAAFVQQTGVNSVTQYELWKAIWSSLNDVNLWELTWALGRHNAMLDHFVPYTFIGNHDTDRIASKVTDARHCHHPLVLLMTLGGIPAIYYGDELGLTATRGTGLEADFPVRPAFPASPAKLHADVNETYRLHQQLIGLRRRHPWLHRARARVVTHDRSELAFEATDGTNRLLVALNLADAPFAFEDIGAQEVIAGAATIHDGRRVEVPPHGWAVLHVNEEHMPEVPSLSH